MWTTTCHTYPCAAEAAVEVGGWRFGGVLAKTSPVGAELGI